jgi:serine/threonine protein kinase
MGYAERKSRDVLPGSSRFEILVKIAAGGMATVYVARSRARGGITRLFAVKRAHPHLAEDSSFRKMFADEARLASRIHHPNVVAVQDVEELDDELLLIMDYVEGAALSDLRDGLGLLDPVTRASVATRVVLDACAGLHAAHELRDDSGRPLDMVHRDISPHNILVGIDGISRVTDFGIAKSNAYTGGGGNNTVTGGLKGKIAYMAPEYVDSRKLDRRADVFGLGVVLWECLAAERLFQTTSEIETMLLVSKCEVRPPSTVAVGLPRVLDEVVMRALARSPDQRYPTAQAFADALERAARQIGALGQHSAIGAFVEAHAGDLLGGRRQKIRASIQGSVPEDPPELSLVGYVHERTATLDPGAVVTGPEPVELTPQWVDSRPRLSRPSRTPDGTLVSGSARGEGVPPKPPARINGLVWASITMLIAAVVIGGWAGARRVMRDREAASTLTPVVPTSATPVPTETPTTTAASAPTATPTGEEPPPEPVASAVTSRPTTTSRPRPKPTTGNATPPSHAPPNPYKKTP